MARERAILLCLRLVLAWFHRKTFALQRAILENVSPDVKDSSDQVQLTQWLRLRRGRRGGISATTSCCKGKSSFLLISRSCAIEAVESIDPRIVAVQKSVAG